MSNHGKESFLKIGPFGGHTGLTVGVSPIMNCCFLKNKKIQDLGYPRSDNAVLNVLKNVPPQLRAQLFPKFQTK